MKRIFSLLLAVSLALPSSAYARIIANPYQPRQQLCPNFSTVDGATSFACPDIIVPNGSMSLSGNQATLTFGSLSGSGTSGQVAFWNGTTSITGDANLTFVTDKLSVPKIAGLSGLKIEPLATGDASFFEDKTSYLSGVNDGNAIYVWRKDTSSFQNNVKIFVEKSHSGVITSTGLETVIQNTGDTFGNVSLRLRNRVGLNGALFWNETLDLVDFGFLPSTLAQNNIRMEHRSGSLLNSGNTTGEFQLIFHPTASPAFPVMFGEAATLLASTFTYVTGTLAGSTSASGNLTLMSTSNATKGKIIFGTSAYDEVNNRLGIGQTVPTAALHLKSGTTAASTAPLKFTSGSLLTTAEAGAEEFLTDKFYGTITTGAARKEFTLNDIALTSGRVPFNTTNGRLTDSSAMTYDGTYLNAPNFSLQNELLINYDKTTLVGGLPINLLSIKNNKNYIAVSIGPISTALNNTLNSISTTLSDSTTGYSSKNDMIFFLESQANIIGGSRFSGVFNKGASNLIANDPLSIYAGAGYVPATTDFPTGAYMSFTADGAWSNASTPGKVTFYTNPVGLYDIASSYPRFYIDSAGAIGQFGQNNSINSVITWDDSTTGFGTHTNRMTLKSTDAGQGYAAQFFIGTPSVAMSSLLDIFSALGSSVQGASGPYGAFAIESTNAAGTGSSGALLLMGATNTGMLNSDTIATTFLIGNDELGGAIFNIAHTINATEDWLSAGGTGFSQYFWVNKTGLYNSGDLALVLDGNADVQVPNNLLIGQTAQLTGTISVYNAINTVSGGVPAEFAKTDLTAQGAAISATTIYAVPSAFGGMYRVSWVATITRASTTSSVLGGATGFQVIYTDADDSVVKTTAAPVITSAANTTGTQISGTFNVWCKASTNLQYAFGYTSIGVTTMQYNLHVKVEAL